MATTNPVDQIARAIHRQYSKTILGEPQKWELRTPDERSAWRLLARTTVDLVKKVAVVDESTRRRAANSR
jgi:hypothetical protein